MQAQLHALNEVKLFLEENQVTYFVIGGIANAVWGRPRATVDADLKLLLESLSLETLIERISNQFKFRVTDPLKFAKQTLVIPIYANNQVPVDLIIGQLLYEEQVADSAQTVEYEGIIFKVCSPEDLIIQKAISERTKDWDDITGILARQGEQLNQDYIFAFLQQFSEILDNSIFLDRYKKLLPSKSTKGKKQK